MRKVQEFENKFDLSNTQMAPDSDQIRMDGLTFFKIFNESREVGAHKDMPLHMVEVVDDKEKIFHMPLFHMSEQRSFNTNLEYQGHSTIVGNSYAGKDIGQPKINSAHRNIANKVGEMISLCLSLQRDGKLDNSMLETLLDVVDVISPEQKLTILLNNTETYNEIKALNELLKSGSSIPAISTSKNTSDAALDNLRVDIAENIRHKNETNEFQRGVLNNMNAYYFEQFTDPQLPI